MKDNTKKALQLTLFILFASLPFISVTNQLGIDAFIDSFEHPKSYMCLKNNNQISGISTENTNYVIIQKKDHPDFNINKDDVIIYCSLNGEISCDEINNIQGVGTFTRYYLKEHKNQEDENIIYHTQIIGKIIKTVDNNIWNELSFKLWDISINNLNVLN